MVPQVPSFRQTPGFTVAPGCVHMAGAIVHPENGTCCVGDVTQHCGGRVVVVVAAVLPVSVTIESTQESTANSIVAPSPLTAHPPRASALTIAASNFISAV